MKKLIPPTIVKAICLSLFISAPSYSHELGIQLYSLRDQLKEDVPATFKLVNEWGLEVVEDSGSLYDVPVAEYKAELERNGLDMVSVASSFEDLRDNPMKIVYKAKYFGAKYATFFWIPHGSGRDFNFDDAKGAVDVMNKAGKVLKDNGITLQYHPHGYEFFPYEDGTLLDYMITNTTEAQFQMDVFWIKQGGMDPVKLLKKYKGRWTSLHLKDRRHGTPDSTNGHAENDTNVILGEGDVGIKAVVKEAKKQGIHYFFIEDESNRVVLQIPKSIEYLQKLDERK